MKYEVLWRPKAPSSSKKWPFDGYLIQEDTFSLLDSNQKLIEKGQVKKALKVGDIFTLKSNDVQIISEIHQLPLISITEATVDVEQEIYTKPKQKQLQTITSKQVKKKARNEDSAGLVLEKGDNLTTFSVVIDHFLDKQLKDHQKIGVKFLYDNISKSDDQYTGCILADEMGLGKTLQVLTLIWTLTKQSILGTPMLKRTLIVTPCSLTANWQKEIKKWLGSERIKAKIVDSQADLDDFKLSRIFSIMICSYDRLRILSDQNLEFDLLVCDEAHRLKNSSSLLYQSLDSLKIRKRILLTGTPIQNNLEEFSSLCSFIRKHVNFNETRFDSSFFLRRTSDMISTGLLPKYEYLVLCEPTRVLKEEIEQINDTSFLALVSKMRKASIPEKFQVLFSLINKIQSDKIILASHFTFTLDQLEIILNEKNIPFYRIDGSTPNDRRQNIVDQFNLTSKTRILLLSAKAGGEGFNLIGANRMVLLDIDWNPAVEAQLLARIWRSGQKKKCFIYRFIMLETIDEEIFLNQIGKLNLSERILNGKFSRDVKISIKSLIDDENWSQECDQEHFIPVNFILKVR